MSSSSVRIGWAKGRDPSGATYEISIESEDGPDDGDEKDLARIAGGVFAGPAEPMPIQRPYADVSAPIYHRWTIQRGAMSFCWLCGLRYASAIDPGPYCTPQAEADVKCNIERSIAINTRLHDIDRRAVGADLAITLREEARKRAYYSNVRAALAPLIGGWNRRAP